MISKLRAACKDIGISKSDCNSLAKVIKEVCGKKKKRAPSKYNIFMGKCVKDRPEDQVVQEAWKDCAAKYREEKKKGKI